jgi:branched-chain amino acid transport system ATP-binding protein
VVLDGSAEYLKGREDVKEFYIGISASGAKKSYKEIKHYKRRKRWL